jgi:hypothetical protein
MHVLMSPNVGTSSSVLSSQKCSRITICLLMPCIVYMLHLNVFHHQLTQKCSRIKGSVKSTLCIFTYPIMPRTFVPTPFTSLSSFAEAQAAQLPPLLEGIQTPLGLRVRKADASQS